MQSARAVSTIPFYESFPTNYAENEQLGATGSSGNVWDQGNSPTASSAHIRSNSALGYVSLVVSNGSRGLTSSTGTGKNRGATITTQTTNVYVSFLLNVQTNPTPSARAFCGLGVNGGTGPTLAGTVLLDPLGRLQVAKNAFGPGTSAATYPLTTGITYLVVFRYKFNTTSSSDDEVALWLDPTSLGNNNSIPPPTVSTTSGNDIASISTFYYLASSSAANFNTICPFLMDEIRISTNWADVTPVTCSPGTKYTVTGGGSSCTGLGFPVGLLGSDTGVDYWLVTNGVFAGQVVSGTGSAISFGTQTVSGLYTVYGSNTISGCVGWMAGGVTVGVLTAPSIVTPPASINVVNNGSGTFSVTASGDGLTYQWQRSGTNLSDGANISGSQTPNLTVDPATANDAGNIYNVIVSGTCTPPATSGVVALTLEAPANLIWSGGNPLNLWDVNTSANFTGSVFNYGDNVTFNDSTAVISVNLVSSYLSPSTITVNAAQNYTFGGVGSIVGPGSLLMAGSGTLTISTFNSFRGGITISNGIVSFNNGLELGTGVITLSGGTLNAANVQGIQVNNPINVTADSTIIVNNTSTSALVLTNSINGSGGTLTFSNATSARGPTIRLTCPGFTNNEPIYLSLGDPASTNYGTNFFLAGFNTNGDQVFNAVISGGGTVQRVSGGGTTMLNAVNTYTNETLIGGGTLLVNGLIGGADGDWRHAGRLRSHPRARNHDQRQPGPRQPRDRYLDDQQFPDSPIRLHCPCGSQQDAPD
jgi:autotransporter-associated beta strand protein